MKRRLLRSDWWIAVAEPRFANFLPPIGVGLDVRNKGRRGLAIEYLKVIQVTQFKNQVFS